MWKENYQKRNERKCRIDGNIYNILYFDTFEKTEHKKNRLINTYLQNSRCPDKIFNIDTFSQCINSRQVLITQIH